VSRPYARSMAAIVVLLLAGSCSSGPTAVGTPQIEVVVASGDGQYATVGQRFGAPLRVIVRNTSTQKPRSGISVVWTVEAGDAAIVGLSTAVSDSTGSTETRVSLGAQTGEVSVRATIQNGTGASADFLLYSVGRPSLDAVAPTSSAPGETVTLTGLNFSSDADQNVVLFSGIRGRVLTASSTQLTVEVPPCLPARGVSVRVQLGTVASDSAALTVEAGGTVHSLAVGETLNATDAAGLTCYALPGSGAEQYLAVVYSASTVGTALHPFQLTGLGSSVPLASPSATEASVARSTSVERRYRGGETSDPQSVWDTRLRTLEAGLTPRGRPAGSRATTQAVGGPDRIPMVGERKSFQVFTASGDFQEVTAVAEYVGSQAVLFVDEAAPSGGYTQADLRLFSDRFDEVIFPTVTDNFGAVSDLDGNGRVVILFTPAVNALTDRGADGFVGGFFFGLDLLPEKDNSNAAEIFYTLVPDPTGVFSDARPKKRLLEVMPAILVHEFQHMVHFNERVLMRGAQANEALWLSEGLAQYAEELVARQYATRGDSASQELFLVGTRDRSRRYLAGTDSVSVIVSSGQGSLAERGAGFLHVLYAADRFGGDLIGRLTRTEDTGVANLESKTGTLWADLLSDWWSAVFLDGLGAETPPMLFPGVDLRYFLGDPFPLNPSDPGSGDFIDAGFLRSSSAKYYIVTPSSGGYMILRLGGDSGSASLVQAALRMRIVRIQ
jgi:hypothetical protein